MPPQTPDDKQSFYQKAPTPDAALRLSLAESAKSETIANRIPKLKKSAYILIGITLFSAAQMLFMQGVVLSVFGNQSHAGFVTAFSWVAWTINIACGITALVTKSARLAKYLIAAVGLSLVYFVINDLAHVDIIGTAIDGFLVWWTWDLYQSVEALAIKTR